MGKVKMVAIDGGYRGLLVSLLMKRLEEARPGLFDGVDVYAGTSSGSVIAGVMANAATARIGIAQTIEFWRNWRPYEGVGLFNPRTPLALSGLLALATREKMDAQLRKVLGDRRLGQLKRGFMAANMQVLPGPDQSGEGWAWHIDVVQNLDPHYDQILLHDAVMRSSAAPLMYPIYQGCLDGGIYANNPALLALTVFQDVQHKRALLDARTIATMQILSFGEGASDSSALLRREDVGYCAWLFDPTSPLLLMDAVATANMQATDFMCRHLLKDRYIRLNPSVDPSLSPPINGDMESYNRALEVAAARVDLSQVLQQLDAADWSEPSPMDQAIGGLA